VSFFGGAVRDERQRFSGQPVEEGNTRELLLTLGERGRLREIEELSHARRDYAAAARTVHIGG
jgi:hypothetical protein